MNINTTNLAFQQPLGTCLVLPLHSRVPDGDLDAAHHVGDDGAQPRVDHLRLRGDHVRCRCRCRPGTRARERRDRAVQSDTSDVYEEKVESKKATSEKNTTRTTWTEEKNTTHQRKFRRPGL